MSVGMKEAVAMSEEFVSMLDRLGLSEEEYQASHKAGMETGEWNPEEAGFVL